MTIKRSVYDDQTDIMRAILILHSPWGFECDVTYGNGKFYEGVTPPKYKFDIDPQVPDVVQASSDALPLANESVKSLVFDPPFLTYIKKGREHNSIMAKRFAGYWRYEELETHYKGTLKEARRVLKKDGVMVFKCQDIIHNHRMHCTHANVINWAADVGFRLKDLFILTAKHRLPMPSKQGEKTRVQKHARVFHSYFLVFQ